MTNLFLASLMHSAFYLDTADRAQKSYLRGGDDVFKGLSMFDRDWANIQKGQAWSANMSEEDEVASKLCSTFPESCIHLLNLRAHSELIISWFEQALLSAEKLNALSVKRSILGLLGLPYLNLGDIQKAIHLFEEHLDMCKHDGDKPGEAASLANLGVAYSELGKYQRSIEYYERSLQIRNEYSVNLEQSAILTNLGVNYLNLGNVA